MSILTLDLETSTKESYKRKANPFCDDNYIVAWGLGYDDQPPKSYYMEDPPADWLDGVKWIVGHNISFDLLYIWERPEFKAWLKTGGRIFCTQFAEYLLSGQQNLYASLDFCAEKYGGELKNDEIKVMWEQGIDTIDIPKDMLLDYLDGDINNTRKVFQEQSKKSKKLNMSNTLMTHFEGLLCIIEMQFNGMFVDKKKALRQKHRLEQKLKIIVQKLEQYIPKDLPPEIKWNWASKDHLSALFFGGKLKYKKQVHLRDEYGDYLYTKITEKWPLVNGEAIHPDEVSDPSLLDTYQTGKKAGAIKYKNITVNGKPKTKLEEFEHPVCRLYTPLPEWETKKAGVYKTDDDVLKVITKEIKVAALMQEWRKVDKDLGTYYQRYDPKKDCDVGMLTLVMPDGLIHHKLNNVSTVTGRLSSSDPNLQNVSSGDKSLIKSVFSSRWQDTGKVLQVDFSQLEVVVKAFMSQDLNMIKDIKSNIDFHCARLAFTLGEKYEDVLYKAKTEGNPDYERYSLLRKKAKPVSFQKAYGASIKGVATKLGMPVAEVKAFFEAEDKLYPVAAAFDEVVKKEVQKSRQVTSKTAMVDGEEIQLGIGYYVAPTGKRYTFMESPAPEWLRKPKNKKQKPILTNFSPTQMKNYQIQGTAGELVYLALGKLYREFLSRDNFNGKALLTNTIHDSILADCADQETALEAGKLIKDCCEKLPLYYQERYGKVCNVPFRSDLEIGDNLKKMKEVK